MDYKIELKDKEKFLQEIQTVRFSEKTKKIYIDYFNRLISISTTLNQDTINKFLIQKIYLNSKGDPNTNVKRAFLKYLIEALDLSKDIYTIRKPRGRKEIKPHRFLKPEQVERMIKHLPRYYSLITRIFIETGLRLNELTNIKVSDIDKNERTIRGIGKGKKHFEVYYSEETAKRLHPFIDFKNKHNKIYIFKQSDVKDSNYKIWYDMKKLCEEPNISIYNFHPHQLRHYLGWKLRVIDKFDLMQIKEVLRHSDISSTQIYSTAHKEEVKAKLKEILQ